MIVTQIQTQKILVNNLKFSQMGFSMLITRLKMLYAKDPSQTTLKSCTDEINAFLKKFASIMTQDFAVISKL